MAATANADSTKSVLHAIVDHLAIPEETTVRELRAAIDGVDSAPKKDDSENGENGKEDKE